MYKGIYKGILPGSLVRVSANMDQDRVALGVHDGDSLTDGLRDGEICVFLGVIPSPYDDHRVVVDVVCRLGRGWLYGSEIGPIRVG